MLRSAPLLFLKSLSPLQRAIAVSVLVHAAVLTVRFADPARFDVQYLLDARDMFTCMVDFTN